MELRVGEIAFHSPGETHASADERAQPVGLHLALARGSRRLGPSPDRTGSWSLLQSAESCDRPRSLPLLHLHAEAGRLTETRPGIIAHPEVARALEQDLIYALVTCLVDGEPGEDKAARRHHASIMGRLEDFLAAHPDQPDTWPELCAAIRVSVRSLRLCCMEFLGMGPNRTAPATLEDGAGAAPR